MEPGENNAYPKMYPFQIPLDSWPTPSFPGYWMVLFSDRC